MPTAEAAARLIHDGPPQRHEPLKEDVEVSCIARRKINHVLKPAVVVGAD